MNKMKYFGIDYCNGQVLFFLRIRHCKNDRQHADSSSNGNDDASHRAFRDEDESGKQHHRHHDATSTGFLRNGHPSATAITADVGS